MQNASAPREVAVMLFPAFSALCLANAVEPLRAANDLSGQRLYRWQFVALNAELLQSSSGLPVQPEARLGEHPGGSLLLVMPSYGHRELATPPMLSTLRRAARRFDVVAGLDTGAWLLARAGLLEGRRATSHWDILAEFSEDFPNLDITEERFIIDGPRASCGGAVTTLDLMLALISQHHGTGLALDVAGLFMHGEQDPKLDPFHRLSRDATLRAMAALMRRHVEEPLPIAEIAARLRLSQRALQALCQNEAGMTPARLYRRIRLANVQRWLLTGQAGISEIAARSGYSDPTAMSRAFRAEFGTTPRAWRERQGRL